MTGLADVVKCRNCLHLMLFAADDESLDVPIFPTSCPLCKSESIVKLRAKVVLEAVIDAD